MMITCVVGAFAEGNNQPPEPPAGAMGQPPQGGPGMGKPPQGGPGGMSESDVAWTGNSVNTEGIIDVTDRGY